MTDTSSPLYILQTDGAAKGNPGPSGIGIVLYKGSDTAEPIAAFGEYIGETTNNVAEYKALIRGLKEALERGADRIEARTDSELMARQIAGRYKVNAPQILPLHGEACRLLSRFEKASVVHVLRGKNALADKLANQGVAAGKAPVPKALTPSRTAPKPAPLSDAALFEAAKDLPVRKLPLSYFDAVLNTDIWFENKPTPLRAVADHARRIYEADRTRPVILSSQGRLLSGSHRLAYAYLTDEADIEVVQFETDPSSDPAR